MPLPASLKTKLAFATSMARGRMLRDLIPGGECARFDAVVLDAYEECPALDQEDRRRDDDVFNVLSASRLATRPPNTYNLELFRFI